MSEYVDSAVAALADYQQQYDDYQAEILAIKAKIAALKDEADSFVQMAIADAPDDEDKSKFAGLAYWFHRELIRVAPFREVFGYNFTSKISKASIAVNCQVCHQNYDEVLESRSDLEYARKKHSFHVCQSCKDNRDEQYQQNRQRHEAYLHELRTMPYTEYLKTDHWQDMRKRMLKYSRYRCAVCNANGVELHVHHRTYENRGHEEYKDLIVLCADCHKTFHDNRTLVKG